MSNILRTVSLDDESNKCYEALSNKGENISKLVREALVSRYEEVVISRDEKKGDGKDKKTKR